ncbi:MAG: hypothetical protein ACI4U9_03315 [Clostridia bacterium]
MIEVKDLQVGDKITLNNGTAIILNGDGCAWINMDDVVKVERPKGIYETVYERKEFLTRAERYCLKDILLFVKTALGITDIKYLRFSKYEKWVWVYCCNSKGPYYTDNDDAEFGMYIPKKIGNFNGIIDGYYSLKELGLND